MATKKQVKRVVTRLTQEWTPEQIAIIKQLGEKTALNPTAVIKLAVMEMAERKGI